MCENYDICNYAVFLNLKSMVIINLKEINENKSQMISCSLYLLFAM